MRNFGDGGVLHVNSQETWSGREKPRGRRSNRRGLPQTWSGREKRRGRRSYTCGLLETCFGREKPRR